MTGHVYVRAGLFSAFFVQIMFMTSTALQFENSEYKLITESKSWPDARKDCATKGGRLASVESSEVQNFLQTKVICSKCEHVWIGGFIGKRWFWTDNQEIDWYYWGPGEPNNDGDQEDKLQLFYGQRDNHFNYKWNDNSGGKKCEADIFSKFVCRYNMTICTSRTECGSFESTSPCILSSHWCYILEGQYVGHRDCINGGKWTWEKSREHCESEGGILAKIEDQQTMEKIIDRIKSNEPRYIGNYWIGGQWNKTAPRIWKWEGGKNVNFTNWMEGEPDGNGASLCMEIWTTKHYRWNDEHCSCSYPYICQFDIPTTPRPSTTTVDTTSTTSHTTALAQSSVHLATDDMPSSSKPQSDITTQNPSTATVDTKSTSPHTTVQTQSSVPSATDDTTSSSKAQREFTILGITSKTRETNNFAWVTKSDNPTHNDSVKFGSSSFERPTAFSATLGDKGTKYLVTKPLVPVSRFSVVFETKTTSNVVSVASARLSNPTEKTTFPATAERPVPKKTTSRSYFYEIPQTTSRRTLAKAALSTPRNSFTSNSTASTTTTSTPIISNYNGLKTAIAPTKIMLKESLGISTEHTVPNMKDGGYAHRADSGNVSRDFPPWAISVITIGLVAVGSSCCLVFAAAYKRKRKTKKIEPDDSDDKQLQKASKSKIMLI